MFGTNHLHSVFLGLKKHKKKKHKNYDMQLSKLFLKKSVKKYKIKSQLKARIPSGRLS